MSDNVNTTETPAFNRDNVYYNGEPEQAFNEEQNEEYGHVKGKEVFNDDEVMGEDKADTYLYVLGILENKREDIDKIAEKQINKVEKWKDGQTAKLDRNIDFLKFKLEMYLRGVGESSMDLPNGKINFRKQTDKVTIVDEEKFLKTANEGLIRTIPEIRKPDLMAIKKHIKETGELVDGVEVNTREKKFYVKLS
ncbi:MAG: putative DNA ends protecting protein [Prokaryotic dsDNA virus sp.]|nr:MAG: putative DNA ends protecting protein [Prokaryotic dsDNA virus sp.]|tara:strand:+ start:923 stop:1504 length:582 start_codon:yes stop_codon:yes gene_type:complete